MGAFDDNYLDLTSTDYVTLDYDASAPWHHITNPIGMTVYDPSQPYDAVKNPIGYGKPDDYIDPTNFGISV